MAQPYSVSKWSGPGFPHADELVARLNAEGLPSVLRADPPGRSQAGRRRPYSMTLWVITGILTVTFVNGNGNGRPREVVLRPGDRLDTRPDARFGYRVDGDGYAFFLEVTPFALPLPLPAPSALPADLEKRSA